MTQRRIFVFGSNLDGHHGAGSALRARREFGARLGVGEGLTGNAYAIPTKDWQLHTLPLANIARSCRVFRAFAEQHQDWLFDVVAIGCGLAGYKPEQIAPFFKDAPSNIKLPTEFRRVLEAGK